MSLIQLLEQRGLLSLATKLRLLSLVERTLPLSKLESSGLLRQAEEGKLLSKAEDFVTNGSTPWVLIVIGSALLGAAYLDFNLPSSEDDFAPLAAVGFLLGFLGVLASGAGFVILFLTMGARRTADLTMQQSELVYDAKGPLGPGSGFKSVKKQKSQTLINTLEEKKLLSLVQDLKLLSLAETVVKNPLATVEQSGLIEQLEQGRALTYLEQASAQRWTSQPGIAGVGIIAAALATQFLLSDQVPELLIILAGLAGVTLFATAAVLTTLQPPVVNSGDRQVGPLTS